jgi:mono/diheme cytochrome c family protein
MVKKLLVITGCVAMVVLASSCSKVRRSPGRAYMPDMYYSRAYETYASTEDLRTKGVHYTGMPVAGTIARDEVYHYPFHNDSSGYASSASITNPLPSLNATDSVEAARLYLINCAICHGDKLDGNGPLFKGGDGPYQAAPKNFLADDMKGMADGTMFHSITYGKGMMGSYASQVSPTQRWMIIHFIRSKQGKAGEAKATAPGATGTTTDSTAQTR